MFRNHRCYFESISAHASGTALGFNPAGDPVFRNHASQYIFVFVHAILSLVSQPCPTVLHRAFPWYWPVHPDIYGFAFYAFYALHCVPKMLFREHLCARFWHRLGLQSCWGSGVSQPCLTVNFCLCACHTFPSFATMPHGAPQGFSMVLAGPSRHIWLCLLCLALPSV